MAVAALTAGANFGLQAFGSSARAKAESEAHEYNARLRRQEADLKRSDASEQASRAERNQNRSLARIRAGFASSGLAETGSPLDIYGEQAGEFETQIADIYTGAEREAIQLENQANLDDFSSSQTKRQNRFNIFSSAVSAATPFAKKGATSLFTSSLS